jgi:hypothetical protein
MTRTRIITYNSVIVCNNVQLFSVIHLIPQKTPAPLHNTQYIVYNIRTIITLTAFHPDGLPRPISGIRNLEASCALD